MPPRKRTAPRNTPKPSQSTGAASESEIDAAKKALTTSKKEYDEKEPPYVDDDEQPIPDDLVFSTPGGGTVEEVEDDPDDVLEFQIDGQTCYAVKPDDGAWILLIRSLGSSKTWVDRIEAIMSIVDDTFDDASKFYVYARLRARNDKFDTNMLADIVTKLVEKWTPEGGNRATRRKRARDEARR